MSHVTTMMTEDGFLNLPENDWIDRELIDGELRERPMTTRGCAHTIVLSNAMGLLYAWNRVQPHPRGRFFCGDIRVRLAADPATFVGADLAYVAADAITTNVKEAKYVDTPVFVVEILSPNDKQQDIAIKIKKYLDAGVGLVWIADPEFSSVTTYRADRHPVTFNSTQDIDAEPFLPGFRVAVADLFE